LEIAYKPDQDIYTEEEAAQALNVSVFRLRVVLDEHIFNDGTARPEKVTFRSSDLVLLQFWLRMVSNPKVIRMPKRP
jgi:hypothetical protein